MRLWIAAAVLLGIAAIGLALGPRAIDWDAYRSDIEAVASRQSGHEVTIGGPIEITFLPRPVLTAKDVTVIGGTDQTLGFELNAGEAEVSLRTGPLLAGRPSVRALRLKRPILNVDGKSSDRLRSWPPRFRDWTRPFARLDLDHIDIAGGRIELLSERSGRRLGLSDLSLQLDIDGENGPLEVEGLFKTKRHRFVLNAAFGPPDKDDNSATKLSIEAQNGIDEVTTLRFNGRVVPFSDDPSLDGRLRLDGPDLQHGLAAIAAAVGSPVSFRAIEEAQPFAVEGLLHADQTGIRSDDLQLQLSEKLGKASIDLRLHPKRQLDLGVELPTLRIAGHTDIRDILTLGSMPRFAIPPGEIELQLREARYRNEAARQASVRLRTGEDRITTVERAKVQLPGLIDVDIDGKFSAAGAGSRFQGAVAAVGDNLKSSLQWLDLIDAGDRSDGWRSFSFESDVDASTGELILSALDLRLDSSKIAGKASLRFGDRPRLSLDADVDRLNLDLYIADLGSAGGEGQSRNTRLGATGLAERLADFGEHFANLSKRLDVFDADVETRFERLTWQGMHIEESVISASLDSGRVTLDEISAKTVGDTHLTLDGLIDLGRQSADLGGELTSEHPARALRHLKVDLPLNSGRLQPVLVTGEAKGTLGRFELALKAGYDQGEASIDGRAGWIEDQPWYDLKVEARHPDHLGLAGQFGLAPLVPAGDAEGPLELILGISRGSAKPWTASGNAKLGPTTFTGSLAYETEKETEGTEERTGETTAGTGPFHAKISIGTPKQDSLSPFLSLAGLKLAGAWTPERWFGRLPAVGLRTAWLDKAEGTLSLASKGGLVGDGLWLDAKLESGLLYIDRLEARPWQGKLEAELSLERRRDQPFLAVAVDLDDVQAAGLAKWLGVKNGIDGSLDLRMEASSAGRTPFDMMAGLAGELAIKAGPGEISGLGIPDLRQTLASSEGDDPRVDRSLSLPFSALDIEADLGRGILTIEGGRLLFDPGSRSQAEAAIDGTLDLLLWITDLTLRPTAGKERDDEDAVFRLVGPPGQPDGYRSSGN